MGSAPAQFELSRPRLKKSTFPPDKGPMRRILLLLALFASVAALAPAASQACSRDDAVFYETFVDTSCLQLPLVNTTLDALGGLRLTTNGTPGVTAWDTHTDFDNGITFQSVTFPPVGVRTLTRTGSGPGATLGLPTTLLPLTLDSASRHWRRSTPRT
jgi:hypothetical protein